MNPRQKFYGDDLLTRNLRSYGYHPKCKKCLTRKEGKCEDPQCAAMGVEDFYCVDYKEKNNERD